MIKTNEVNNPQELLYSPVDQFDKAMERGTIINERQEEYGDAVVQMRDIALMQVHVEHCEDISIKHCLNMIIVKMIRLCNNPMHVDSAIDIAGYARIITQIQSER